MQRVVKRGVVVPVRFSRNEIASIDKTVKRLGLRSRSALIREAAHKYVQDVGGLKVIEIRGDGDIQRVKEEILAYLRQHKEAETFDIANDLRLDLDLTVKALKELWEGGKVS